MLDSLTFLTPRAGLLALAALAPLTALVIAGARVKRARTVLRLPEPRPGAQRRRSVAVVSVPLLIALALAQPALAPARLGRDPRRCRHLRRRRHVELDGRRRVSASAVPPRAGEAHRAQRRLSASGYPARRCDVHRPHAAGRIPHRRCGRLQLDHPLARDRLSPAPRDLARRHRLLRAGSDSARRLLLARAASPRGAAPHRRREHDVRRWSGRPRARRGAQDARRDRARRRGARSAARAPTAGRAAAIEPTPSARAAPSRN